MGPPRSTLRVRFARPMPSNPATTPADATPSELTRLLQSETPSYDEILPIVYHELRAMAQSRLGSERPEHTLSATALVHEAYLRLTNGAEIAWNGRAHFFHAASNAMRRVLIDHARSRLRDKRGGGASLEERARALAAHKSIQDFIRADDMENLLSLDETLCRLEEEDADLGAIVRLRFYAGLSIEQTAAALGLSTATIKRRWAFARAWLAQHALSNDQTPGDSDGTTLGPG